MKRIVLVVLATTLFSMAAHADGTMGGIGFRSTGYISVPSFAPITVVASPTIGVRHWLSERVGLDGAIGFATASAEVAAADTLFEKTEGTALTFDAGVPFSMKKWEKVNLIVRPGLIWSRATLKGKTTPTPPKDTATLMVFTGEIEVEWMVAEHLGISASHGIAYSSFKEENGSSTIDFKSTGFLTTGNNFTSLGFHVYVW